MEGVYFYFYLVCKIGRRAASSLKMVTCESQLSVRGRRSMGFCLPLFLLCFNPSILFGLEITPAASFAQAAPGEKVKIGKTAAGQTKSGPREVEPALPRDLRASERPFGVGAADRAPGPRPAAKSPGRLSESQAPPPGPERQGPLFLQGEAGAGRRVGGPPTCRLLPSPGPPSTRSSCRGGLLSKQMSWGELKALSWRPDSDCCESRLPRSPRSASRVVSTWMLS